MSCGQKGFSIVAALIGLAVVGGFGLVIMQQQESASKMQSKDNADQVINSAANVVGIALSSRAVCSMSLKNKGLGDSVPSLFDAKVNPNDINVQIIDGPNLVDVGQLLPNDVKVQEMKIIADKDGNEFLSVIFNRNPTGRKNSYGSDTIGKQFRLQGEKDPTTNKYTSCYLDVSNTITSVHQQACTDTGGSWIDGKCVEKKAPIYHDTLNGVLLASPKRMLREQMRHCDQCHDNCNPCAADEIQGAGGCTNDGSCKITKQWRGCDFNCIKDFGMTPKLGDMLINLPK